MKAFATVWVLLISAASISAATNPAEEAEIERTHMSAYECAISPSRQMIALSGIGLADVSPSIRMRMRILVVDLADSRLVQILTWLKSPWAVVWSPTNSLIACGRRDEGEKEELYVVLVYDLDRHGKVTERVPTNDEYALAKRVYLEKFGNKPKT